MNKTNRSQHYYMGHSEAVSALALTTDGQIAATGTLGYEASVVVWRCKNGEPLVQLEEKVRGQVLALAFSPDGSKLAVVGGDPDHTISLWDWQHSVLLSRGYGGSDPIFHCCFAPIVKDSPQLLVASMKDLKVCQSHRLFLSVCRYLVTFHFPFFYHLNDEWPVTWRRLLSVY